MPTSKSFIMGKSLSLWICKRSLPKTNGAMLIFISIASFKEAGFKQSIFMDNNIPSGFIALLTFLEAATRVILYKKLLLKISQYLQENTCVGVSFIKRRLQHRYFPVNIAKCLRTPILKNSYECRLLRLTLGPHLRVPPYRVSLECPGARVPP